MNRRSVWRPTRVRRPGMKSSGTKNWRVFTASLRLIWRGKSQRQKPPRNQKPSKKVVKVLTSPTLITFFDLTVFPACKRLASMGEISVLRKR